MITKTKRNFWNFSRAQLAPLFRSKFRIFVFLLIAIYIISCFGVPYEAYNFSYPPGSDPMGQDWKYRVKVYITGNQPPILRGEKKVKIWVNDSKREIEVENFTLVSHAIEARATWNEEERLLIQLFDDDASYPASTTKNLRARREPKLLRSFTYNPVQVLNAQ